MTLRIRELVIRAEIGRDRDSDTSRQERRPRTDLPPVSKPDSMTHRFYEEDFPHDNER